ncbi:hypothetical protein GCM10008967_21330 [Bacillus carboniphilus]|uniref:Integral inner membrane protein n=1 Tax=Bacillus carboniphilus TaxID=86663 RepID=A0ABP3G1I8_9BACI
MSLIGWLIVACEIGFWIVIILGLLIRYIWKKEKLGFIFLALTPLIDLVLLIATSYDLLGGATANLAHGIAAIYIGVSIAYGKSMIQWADTRFQYYILKTREKPQKRFGLDHAKHEIAGWLKHVLAYLIGAALLLLMVYMINDHARTEALTHLLKIWTLVLGIDLAISVSYFVFPRKDSRNVHSNH